MLRWVWFIVSAAALVGACSSAPTPSLDRRKLRVAYGRYWVSHESATIAVPDGNVALPDDAHVAKVFLDRNGNGRLDSFAEPSALCRSGETWQCNIALRRLVLHRIERSGPTGLADQTFIVGESFVVGTGAPDRRARLCVAGTTECAGDNSGPYLATSAGTRVLAPCSWDPSESIALSFTTATGPMVITATLPSKISLDVSVTAKTEGIEVVGRTSIAPDQGLVWLKRVNVNGVVDVVWTSEMNDSEVTLRPDGLFAMVPDHAVSACDGACTLVVQVAHSEHRAEALAMTEGQWERGLGAAQ